MLLSSTSTPPRSHLARRRPSTVTNLELCTNNITSHALTIQRAINEFLLPLRGENFDVRDSNGRPTLHEAVQIGYEAVVEYLIELLMRNESSIHLRDLEGVIPHVLANRSCNYTMATALVGTGHIQEPHEISVRPFQEDQVKEEGHLSLMSMKMSKKDALKWVFALLNVGVELSQALLSQERTTYWENKASCYRRLSVTLSLVCLLLSVSEMVYEAKRDGVEWKKRGACYWFYYPGRDAKTFGTFMLWFSLLSSIVQLCLSLLTLTIKKDVLKFDYMGLLLSVFYLLSRFGCRKRTMRGVIMCGEHGEREVGGRLEQGRWVFECSLCRLERVV